MAAVRGSLIEADRVFNVGAEPVFVDDSVRISPSEFVPARVLNYINQKPTRSVKQSYTLMGIKTKIEITGFTPKNTKDDRLLGVVCYVLSAIIFILRHSADPNIDTLSVKIYLTPFKKTGARGKQLGVTNINSGYCGKLNKKREIVIYREEEWFKVLLHEILHACTCGPSTDVEAAFAKYMHQQFNIADVSLEESYVEFWARIISKCYAEQNISDVEEAIGGEVMYSEVMSQKVLSWYPDYCDKKDWIMLNANVFSYYVLASAFLRDWSRILIIGTTKGRLTLNYRHEYTIYAKNALTKLINDDCKKASAWGKGISRISVRMSLSDAIV